MFATANIVKVLINQAKCQKKNYYNFSMSFISDMTSSLRVAQLVQKRTAR